MGEDRDASGLGRQRKTQEVVVVDGRAQRSRVVPELADLGRRLVHERKVTLGGTDGHRREQRIAHATVRRKRCDVEAMSLHEDVQPGRVAASHLEAIDARQRELHDMHGGDSGSTCTRTGEVGDRHRSPQTVAADRPAAVLQPDERLVESLEVGADQRAVPRVDPRLQVCD